MRSKSSLNLMSKTATEQEEHHSESGKWSK
jgi:hypothetical protein